jgi:hypothetical protein
MPLAGGLATNQDLAYTQGFRSLHAWVDSQVISAPSRKCVAWLRPPPSSGPRLQGCRGSDCRDVHNAGTVSRPNPESVRSIFAVDACIFCGSADVTKEHLIADWVFRAVQRNKHPRITVFQRFEDGRLEDQFGEQQLAATVLCQACNNGWIGSLDKRASELLKPLVCNLGSVSLEPDEQVAVATWAFKTVLVNDMPITGGASELSRCAPQLRESGVVPSFIEAWAGPPALALGGDFRAIGVVPEHGELVLGTGREAQRSTLHVWRLMLGYVDLLLRPTLRWVPLPDPEGFGRIFPGGESRVLVAPFHTAQNKVSWGPAPSGMVVNRAS